MFSKVLFVTGVKQACSASFSESGATNDGLRVDHSTGCLFVICTPGRGGAGLERRDRSLDVDEYAGCPEKLHTNNIGLRAAKFC